MPIVDKPYANFNTSQSKTLDKLLLAINTLNTSQATSITNLNAWATALATKLNADAGVTDVNYDITPQS